MPVTTLFRGGTLVEFEPATVEVADLRVDGGRVVERAPKLEPRPGEEVIDVIGKYVCPGLVSAHHRLAAPLLRGLRRPGVGFAAEQQLLRQLEEGLRADDVEAAAAVVALEGLLAGTTTFFGVTASPAEPVGSLQRAAAGVSRVGTRAVLAAEVSDRAGPAGREAALAEAKAFLGQARGRLRGAWALAQLGALGDEALGAVRDAQAGGDALLLATVAEDPLEEGRSQEAWGATPVDRLAAHGLVGERVVLAHGVHLSWPDLSSLISAGTWLAHTPRSNMASQSGHATASKFGVRACLGTDVMGLDVLAEAQVAALRASDSGQPIDPLRFLANGHRLASQAFGVTLGPLREGAAADLVVLDYAAPTALDAESLAGHVLFGLTSRAVESVMVDGLWRLWKRKPLGVDPADLARACRESSLALASRAEGGAAPPA